VDDSEDHLRQLEETVRILAAENEALTDRAEDMLLLGLIAEKVGVEADPGAALDAGLEQLALLKDIPFSACVLLEGGDSVVWAAYLARSDRALKGLRFPSVSALRTVLEQGTIEVTPGEGGALGLDALFASVAFVPAATLAVSFGLQAGGAGFFLFSDDRPDSRFPRSTVMLNRVVEVLVSRLDTLLLLEALKASNLELDRRVLQRTQALDVANAELRRHVAALRESQQEHEKLSALVESSYEFVGMSTLDGRVIYVNEAGRRLAGLAPDLPLDGLTVIDLAPERLRAALSERILPAVKLHGVWQGETAILNRVTGSEVPVDFVAFVIPSKETGAPLCLATIVRDTSERVRAREQQATLEAQLRQAQKMESIGRLAGGVAHDFNNLLTTILGNVELALDSVLPSDPIRPMLEDVRKAGDSAASLTRQLLAFSRKQMIEPKVLNLGALLASMERMLRRLIGEDIVLHVEAAPGLPAVRADAGQLQQVILNLAANARDAMPGGGNLRIEVSTAAVGEALCEHHPGSVPGDYLVLTIADTGVGMDEATTGQIFEPFFTTKPTGTGLGLSTVYGAVVQNGGFVTVASAVGEGTTFRVYLPALTEASTADDAAQAPFTRGSGTILLVEDEPLVRELARRALTAFGYLVIACPGGPEALQAAACHQGAIDLLMTDVVMPGMNGREVAERLAAIRPGIPVLFTSGYTSDVIVNHGVLDEKIQFLGKPYTPQALAEKVQAVLVRR
jgi:PAS domain S-box-containing protein